MVALAWANSPWREGYHTLDGTHVGPAGWHLNLTLGARVRRAGPPIRGRGADGAAVAVAVALVVGKAVGVPGTTWVAGSFLAAALAAVVLRRRNRHDANRKGLARTVPPASP